MPTLKKPPWQAREESITKALKCAMTDKGWTQAHLAKLLHKKQPEISRIINAPLKRDLGNILMIADKLGLNLIAENIFKTR